MLLNDSKKTALIQLINCKEKWTVKNINDLFDGKLFCDIIQEVFPETFELLKKEGQIIINYEELSKSEELRNNAGFELDDHKMVWEHTECENTVIKDSGAVQKYDTQLIKSAVHDSESILPTTSASESVLEQVDSAAGDEETVTNATKSVVSDGESVSKPVECMNNSESSTKPSEKDKKLTSNRYRLIQYFIDVRYNIKSETVITFSECWGKNELELAKVLIFIMSEVVRQYVRSNDPLIQTLSHVDASVQQNLEHCFNFFINERSKLTKEEVERILASSVYKMSSSPNNGYCSTPRSCSSKYRRLSPKPTTQLQENVFTNSPLKTYFESPVFTKADIVSKEKEILKMKQILYEEESNSCSLERKIQELEKKLEEKNKEIINFKMRNRVLQDKEKSEDCENCVRQENIIEENKRRIKELEVDIKEHNEETAKQFEEKFVEYQVDVANNFSAFFCNLRETKKEIKEVTEHLYKTKREKSELEETVKKLSEELEEKTKELEVYKEKLSYAGVKMKEEPESPVPGECMGRYFEGENEKFSFDVSHIKLALPTEEKSVNHVMVQFPEEKVITESQVEFGESKPELSVSSNLPDCKNEPDLKKCSENVEKEFQLDTDSKQFVCPAPKEASFVENSSSVTKDNIGCLWHQYDNSISKNENGNNNYISVRKDDVFVPEIENTDEDNSLTKALNILHKTEYDLNQMSKHLSAISKVSTGPNGSNGLFGSSKLKDFLEELKKSLQKSVLCLSQAGESQMKCQNNNSISRKMIEEVGGNSNVAVFSKCFECSKVGNDISNNTVGTIINQESSALREKTQELDNLNDKYKVALKSWTLKEKEFETCKKKYFYLKARYQESLRNTKEMELKYQKLENDLKEAMKRENDFKRESKREKCILKMQMRNENEKWERVQSSVLKFKMKLKEVTVENKQLCYEISKYINQNERLSSHIKYLEKQIEEANNNLNSLPSTSSATKENESVKGKEDAVSEDNSDDTQKLECLSANLSEVTSHDTENESTSCALQHKSFHSGLHLYNDDEEEFFNHSSLIAIHRGHASTPQDLTRVHELYRRNTLVPRHLQSHYAVENLPETPIEKNCIKGNKLKSINPGPENNVHIGKKRKISEIETQNQSSQFSTPVVKTKRKLLQTPTNLKKWCLYRRNQRSGSIKPKP